MGKFHCYERIGQERNLPCPFYRMTVRKKKILQIISLLPFLTLVVSIAHFYNAFQKPAQKDVTKLDVAAILDADDLIRLFRKDKKTASDALVEQVVQVQGEIKEISFINDRYTILLKSKNFTKSFVMCEMASKNLNIENLAVGDTLKLRGICKGYLLDVIMLNCVPINENTNP